MCYYKETLLKLFYYYIFYSWMMVLKSLIHELNPQVWKKTQKKTRNLSGKKDEEDILSRFLWSML